MPWVPRGGEDDAAGAVLRVRLLPGFSADPEELSRTLRPVLSSRTHLGALPPALVCGDAR
jgi:hypothetical protein